MECGGIDTLRQAQDNDAALAGAAGRINASVAASVPKAKAVPRAPHSKARPSGRAKGASFRLSICWSVRATRA